MNYYNIYLANYYSAKKINYLQPLNDYITCKYDVEWKKPNNKAHILIQKFLKIEKTNLYCRESRQLSSFKRRCEMGHHAGLWCTTNLLNLCTGCKWWKNWSPWYFTKKFSKMTMVEFRISNNLKIIINNHRKKKRHCIVLVIYARSKEWGFNPSVKV